METLANLIASTHLGDWVMSSAWIWPIAEIIHFFGITLLLGTIGILDLRILGVAKGVPIGALEKLVPLGILGFLLVLMTGVCFVSAETPTPAAFVQSNLAFRLKVYGIVLAGLNALAFYVFGFARKMDRLPAHADAPLGGKVIAAVSLVLWVGVIGLGRLIMYDATLLDFLGL